MKKHSFLLLMVVGFGLLSFRWGFFSHRKINRLAVFTLPPPIIRFYKHHIVYLAENAINPDQRRYAMEGEAPRHYIDLEDYGDSALQHIPRRWQQAVDAYTEDSLQQYGIVPWHIYLMKIRLTQAFETHDLDKILRYSADIGHYIADANVPLHTTKNYNGQLTGQYGIHGFWESRLPELFFETYDCFVGQANYVEDVQEKAWQAVAQAHTALDSVLSFEKELSARFDAGKKYTFQTRGKSIVKNYSEAYAKAYHEKLGGMVERQMRASVKMVGDIWFTCWVDAGQPDIEQLLQLSLTPLEAAQLEQEKKTWRDRKVKSRAHH